MEPSSGEESLHKLEDSLYKIDELMIHLSRRLHVQIARQVPNELTQSQFALCKLVKKHGRMTVSELAESLGVSLSAITVTADKLCRSGIMRRQRSEQDRRVVWVMLTEEGDRVLSSVLDVWSRTLKGYFAQLPAGDMDKLVSICENLLVILRAEEERAEVKEEG